MKECTALVHAPRKKRVVSKYLDEVMQGLLFATLADAYELLRRSMEAKR